MERDMAIKKISERFLIPAEDIINLLEKKNGQRNFKSPSPKKVIKIPKRAEKKQMLKPETATLKYLFTESDFNLLIEQIAAVVTEIKRLGGEIGDSVSDSKTFHDNFEYEELGRQQKMWTNRLRHLEKFKGNVEIIKVRPTTKFISIGSEVKIEMENGEILTKKIGSYITFSENDLSYNSPLAKLMMGKGVGEKIQGKVDKQFFSFLIKEIR